MFKSSALDVGVGTLFLLNIFINATVVANTITSLPTNAMFNIGAVIKLQCAVDTLAGGGTLEWSQLSPRRGLILCWASLTEGVHCYGRRYSISTTNVGVFRTAFDLVIHGTRLSDGGSYQCAFSGHRTVATIVVVGKHSRNDNEGLPSQNEILVSPKGLNTYCCNDADTIQLNAIPMSAVAGQVIPVSCNVTYQSVPYETLHTIMTPVAHLNISSDLTVSSTAAAAALRQRARVTLSMVS